MYLEFLTYRRKTFCPETKEQGKNVNETLQYPFKFQKWNPLGASVIDVDGVLVWVTCQRVIAIVSSFHHFFVS